MRAEGVRATSSPCLRSFTACRLGAPPGELHLPGARCRIELNAMVGDRRVEALEADLVHLPVELPDACAARLGRLGARAERLSRKEGVWCGSPGQPVVPVGRVAVEAVNLRPQHAGEGEASRDRARHLAL